MTLAVNPQGNCRIDLVALGEVMLRLDPGEGRIRTARQFRVWEGGGEYNVARGLARCFRMRTALVTALADNEIGRLIEDCILQGGVDGSLVQWIPFDGTGFQVRNGLNFTERGFGVRGAVGCSDRGHSAASQMRRGDVDWNELFGERGVRWFHTGGIFASLSATTPEVVLEAMSCARSHGTIVSYDLNYRPSLWQNRGGPSAAREVNRSIAPLVDVMIGNEEDFTACLGLEVEGVDSGLGSIDINAYERMIGLAIAQFPNLRAAATTLRTVHTASRNDWRAVLWLDGRFYRSRVYDGLEILDRVGGGDSFASGLIYGMLADLGPQLCVDYGAAHGALAMTTPGDTSMASLAEVEKLVRGGGARVER